MQIPRTRSTPVNFRHGVVLASAALLLFCQFHASAQVVSFNFSGTISSKSDPDGKLPADIDVGTGFSGTVTYDVSGLSDSNSDPERGTYDYGSPNENNFSMSITLGSHVVTSIPTSSSPFNQVIAVNTPSSDNVAYIANDARLDGAPLPDGVTKISAFPEFHDSSATALSSDAIPQIIPLLTTFPNLQVLIIRDINGSVFNLGGDVTSVSAVPEPTGTGIATGVGLASFVIWRRIRSKLV